MQCCVIYNEEEFRYSFHAMLYERIYEEEFLYNFHRNILCIEL